MCCDDASGGVVDDLIAYVHGDEDVFLVPNAANTAEVVSRLAAAAPDGASRLAPRSEALSRAEVRASTAGLKAARTS
jgi:aminomethyltransferase